MLHAIAQKKSMRHKNYHLDKKTKFDRAEDEKHIREEDEITSTILGPLDFLNNEDSYKFWKAVIGLNRRDVSLPALPNEAPISGNVTFWPKNKVEPDAFFEYRWKDGRRINFLLEIKWNAPLSGEDQLSRQWSDFLTPSQQSDSIHIFISPDIATGVNAIQNLVSKEHSKRMIPLSWSQICEVFEEFEKNSDGRLGKWSSLSRRFLERAGVSVFKGFLNITSNITNSETVEYRGLFQVFNFKEILKQINNQEISEFLFSGNRQQGPI